MKGLLKEGESMINNTLLDGAARFAADCVGSELFRVVQNAEGTTTQTP
jgi:hypothetical protein